MFTKIFEELDLSPITQQVFNELIKSGASSAKRLAEQVSIPRSSVYDHLKILIEKGLVMERNEESKKIFVVDNINNIEELLNDKIQILEKEKSEFKKILPQLLQKTNFIEPKVKFYSGKEGVKQVINQVLLNRDIETVLMWPMSEMMKVLGDEYLKELNIKRVQRNISLRAIWPKDKILNTQKYPYLGTSSEHKRDLRIAPQGMNWDMGYWAHGDKVAFLSSEKEGFGFIIHSRDFAKLIKVQFEQIWKISKPIK
jgi:sugar-specific transcriptional regulator TrmB